MRHLAVAALLLGIVPAARAEMGNGIRFGGSEGRLHPYVELQGGYDTNVYNAAGSNAAVGDVIIHVRPGFNLTIPAEVASVDLSANVDWAQYLGIKDTGSKDLSQLYAAAKLGVNVNAKGMVGLQVDDQFRRSNRPQALTFTSGVISNFNALDLHVPIKPGGGALTVTLSGDWTLESFEAPLKGFNCPVAGNPLCNASNVSKLGYNELSGGAAVSWRFFPRTSVLLEGNYFERIPNDKSVTPYNADPAGYRVLTGLTGLITPHLTATVKGGYGSSLNVTPAMGTWLAVLQTEWAPSETTSVSASYAHDFGIDPGTALYETHRFAVGGRQLVGGRLSVGAHASFDILSFKGGGSTDVFQVGPSLGYEVTRWLHTEVAVAYTDRSSSKSLPGIINYSRTEAWLKLVATY